MRVLAVAIPLVVVLAAIAACDEDFKECYAGDRVACSCGGKSFGYARCNDRESYDPCVCDGTTPGLDAGNDGAR